MREAIRRYGVVQTRWAPRDARRATNPDNDPVKDRCQKRGFCLTTILARARVDDLSLLSVLTLSENDNMHKWFVQHFIFDNVNNFDNVILPTREIVVRKSVWRCLGGSYG